MSDEIELKDLKVEGVELGPSGTSAKGRDWQIWKYTLKATSTEEGKTYTSFDDHNVKVGDWVDIKYVEKPNVKYPQFPYLNLTEVTPSTKAKEEMDKKYHVVEPGQQTFETEDIVDTPSGSPQTSSGTTESQTPVVDTANQINKGEAPLDAPEKKFYDGGSLYDI